MNHVQPFEDFNESRRREELVTSGQTSLERGYVVRVELHQIENPKDYEDLRTYMLAADFTGVLVNENGVRFKLPTATYYHPYPDYMQFSSYIHEKATKAVHEALNDANTHIKSSNRPPTILVTEANNLYWTGLELADENDG